MNEYMRVVDNASLTTNREHKHQTKDGRWQCQFRFFINANNPEEDKLGKQLAKLKQQRRYSSTIKDALRLIFDLRAGRTEVLFVLFPGLQAQLQPPSPGVDLSAIERQLAALQTQICQQSAGPRAASKPAEPGVVLVAGSKASAKTVADNFLKSFSSQFFG
jgi:hypothetical protein